MPSGHRPEPDESAAVEAITGGEALDSGPRPAGWLHLVLAVDDGPSMRVWRDTIGDLACALMISGIFRSVRVSPIDSAVRLTGDGTAVLAVTDGVADHWYTGAAHAHLTALARTAPTAVLQLLPTRLWSSTGLPAEPMIVRTIGPAPPNRLLTAHAPWLPASMSLRPGLPVPVLEPDEPSLRPWAELIASHGGAAALRVIDAERPLGAVPFGKGTDSAPGTAVERVQSFRATVSPQAYELAGHLAAVDPLTLPVMRLVQAAVLPESTPVSLAEVLLSGLMHVDESLEGQDVFAFAPDVRGVLRTVVRAGSAQRTVDAVSDFVAPRLGRTPHFPAAIAERTVTLALRAGGEPLAEPTPSVPGMRDVGRGGKEGGGVAGGTRAPFELLLGLTDALCDLACMEDPQGRRRFATVLGELLGRSINIRGVKLREDVVATARAVLDVAGGERLLLESVRILEGNVSAGTVERVLTSTDGVGDFVGTGSSGPLSDRDKSSARAVLDKSAGNLSGTELRDRLVDELGITIPVGLSPAQLFEYLLAWNVQPDGLPSAVLLMECAAQSVRIPGLRAALSGWAHDWAGRAGLPAQLEQRRAARTTTMLDPSIPTCLVVVVEHAADGSEDIIVRPWLNTVPGRWDPRPEEPTTTTLDGLGPVVEEALRLGAQLWDRLHAPTPTRFAALPCIEFVLPYDLLNHDLSGMTIRSGDGPPLPLGLRYGVHLRSLERMRTSNAQVRARWQERWRTLHTQGVTVHDWQESNEQGLEVWQRTLAREPSYTAAMLDAPRDPAALDTFKVAVAEGIGIAVWDRRGSFVEEQRQAITAVIASGPTREQLPMAIHRLRRKTEHQEDRLLSLGQHIAFLWDDPTRLVDV